MLLELHCSFCLSLMEYTHVHTTDYTHNLPFRLLCFLPKGMVAPEMTGTAGNSSKRALLPPICLSSLRAFLFWPGGSFATCDCAFAHMQRYVCQFAVTDRQTNSDATMLGLSKGLCLVWAHQQERFLLVKGCHPLLCNMQFDPYSCQLYFEASVPNCTFPIPRWEAKSAQRAGRCCFPGSCQSAVTPNSWYVTL